MAGKITNQELDSSVVTKLSSSDSHISNTSNPHSTTASQVGAEPANANIQTHIGSTSNPHGVTPSQIGAEPANSNIQSHIIDTSNPHSTTASQIGLGNVTNESKETMFTNAVFTGSGMKIPVGNTAQRPTGEAGLIRYNTDKGLLEFYDGKQFMWLGVGEFIATGGIITEAGGYKIHVFTSSGSFQIVSGIKTVEYLVVAGGGGGGADRGGTGGTSGNGRESRAIPPRGTDLPHP